MPNFCRNTLKVTNLLPEEKAAIKAAATSTNLLETFIPEPNWLETPDENGETPTANNEKTRRQFADGSPDSRWYLWRNENWGTKWDISEVFIDDTEENTLHIEFLSPWCPPSQGLTTISELFKEATFLLTYEESGCDFCGASLFENGKVVTYQGKSISSMGEEWLDENAPHLGEDDEDEKFDLLCEVTGDLINEEWKVATEALLAR